MKKIKISAIYVESFWACICEGAEIPNKYLGLNLSNPDSVKELTLGFLAPSIKSNNDSWHYSFKESLRYAINFWDDAKLLDLYMAVLPQIAPPNKKYMSMKAFYSLVWELVYPGEEYLIQNQSQYIDVSSLEIGAPRLS